MFDSILFYMGSGDVSPISVRSINAFGLENIFALIIRMGFDGCGYVIVVRLATLSFNVYNILNFGFDFGPDLTLSIILTHASGML